MDRRVYLFSGKIWLGPVEDPPFIRTGSDAISATNAPVVIHDDDPIRFLPGGMNRAHLHTWRILTLLALNGEIDESLFRN